MSESEPIAICWLRRDLRLDDNAALYHALKGDHKIIPLFIFDTNILDKLQDKTDRRVQFIHDELVLIQKQLKELGSDILVKYGKPKDVWNELIADYNIAAVYINHDFEPYARDRDGKLSAFLARKDISLHTYKDHVIFEKDEVTKDDGLPYTVYTPYSRKWKEKLKPFYYKPYPNSEYFANFYKVNEQQNLPSLEDIGFQRTDFVFPPKTVKSDTVKMYASNRDFPAIQGTTHLGIHLRFGTLSVRRLLAYALDKNQTFVKELIWRDFYQQILWHFPHVANEAFKKDYNFIEWQNDEELFKNWCQGKTGYPLVDAGMRELNATGFMHNRVRMVTASFLAKHLLIDWRWGEAYFAEKLLDFDLAANNGGWQWSAGCGTDAAPYFRVFSPQAQMLKFDPDLIYVRKWVPEYGTSAYPKPIVDHDFARKRCLEVYKKAVGKED
ncbi:MAG: deoxyribodipyrimidine photolyase [Bacteroidetes bacterium]|nr:deoxyribodipyrimidine photolyase [Bacteroidota bacterium]